MDLGSFRFKAAGLVCVAAALIAACSDKKEDGPDPDVSAGGDGSGGTANIAGSDSGGADSSSCSPGAAEPCYESEEGTPYEGTPPEGQNTCRFGERRCEGDGTWGACIGAVAPKADDTCDPGDDANCNGSPNEGCACDDGEMRPCGKDEGNCAQGEQLCVDGAWSTCDGEVTGAAVDTCDEGDDANCNGIENEGCSCLNGTEKSCGTDVGPCELGTVTCVNGVYPEACAGGVQPAAADTCEPGNDANCNNTANEGCACTGSSSVECGIDVGACTLGTQSCDGGVLGGCMDSVGPTVNDTCFAADEANDMNCNGVYRDGCTCVETDPAASCGDAGCGSKSCDGATGDWNACVGDGTTHRCNPNSPDSRQLCGSNGAWTADACPANTVCRDDGDSCKLVDGEPCVSTTECATSSCNTFYVDVDEDGYRGNSTIVKFCGDAKDGYVRTADQLGDDCEDNEIAINPGATEECDGIDNDCDNEIDMADNAGLVLSGNAKTIESGTDSAVASSGSTYAMVFTGDGKTNFTSFDQAGTIVVAQKELNSVASTTPALVWDGSQFGMVYRVYGGNIYFRKATTAGVFSPASPVTVGNEGTGALDASLARIAGQGWYFAAWGTYATGQWVYGYTVSSGNVPSAYIDIDTSARYPHVAASGDNFGLVYNDGAYGPTGTQTLRLSIKDSSGAETASTTLGDSSSEKKAAIAARPDGGFAVMWNQGGSLYFQEVSAAGGTLCGPINLSFANFLPDQMVPTKRGYLAVSGYNGVVKLQEVIAGCSWGTSFTNIGAGAETIRAHIAGGSSGFAVVWDNKHGSATDQAIYVRTFGPNLCD